MDINTINKIFENKKVQYVPTHFVHNEKVISCYWNQISSLKRIEDIIEKANFVFVPNLFITKCPTSILNNRKNKFLIRAVALIGDEWIKI